MASRRFRASSKLKEEMAAASMAAFLDGAGLMVKIITAGKWTAGRFRATIHQADIGPEAAPSPSCKV